MPSAPLEFSCQTFSLFKECLRRALDQPSSRVKILGEYTESQCIKFVGGTKWMGGGSHLDLLLTLTVWYCVEMFLRETEVKQCRVRLVPGWVPVNCPLWGILM